MSSPLDFSEFIEPNASTGSGSTGSGSTGHGTRSGDQNRPWSTEGGATSSAGWLSPHDSAPSGIEQAFGAVIAQGAPRLDVASPPLRWLYAAGTSAVIGAVLSWLLDASALTLIGWALAGPVAIGFIGVYHRADTLLRTSGLYSEPSWTRTLYSGVVGLCLCAVIVAAVFVGLWWGRA